MVNPQKSAVHGDVMLRDGLGKVSREEYERYIEIFEILNRTNDGKGLVKELLMFMEGGVPDIPIAIGTLIAIGILSETTGKITEDMTKLLKASTQSGKVEYPAEMVEIQGTLFLAQDVNIMRGLLNNLKLDDDGLYSALLVPFAKAIELMDAEMYITLGLINQDRTIPYLVQLIILEIENEKKEK